MEESDFRGSLDESVDAFELFNPEVSAPARTLPAPVEPDRPPVSLATLADAGITPDGDEAIAIGQALCQSFSARQFQGSVTASVSSPVSTDVVFIDATGRARLSVKEPDNVSEAVQCVAKVLSDILPSGSYWLFRTRVLSRALTAPAEFASLNELELELSVYERQNGTNLIRALYERWANRRNAKDGPVAIDPPVAIVPPAAFPVAPEWPRRTAATRPTPRIKIIMVLMFPAVAVLGLGGWMLLSEQRSQAAQNPPERAIASEATIPSALEQPGPAVSRASSLADASGPTVRVPPRRPVGAPTVAAPPPHNAQTVDISGQSVAPARSRVDVASKAENITAVTASRGSAPTASPERTALGYTLVTASEDDAAAPPPQRTTVIYGGADLGVTPPVPVLARLSAGLRPDSPNIRWEVLTIEVVINADGRVDTAKGLVAPQTMGETMLLTQALSSVKSWAFKPATRDGVPVPYRQVIRWHDLTSPAP